MQKFVNDDEIQEKEHDISEAGWAFKAVVSVAIKVTMPLPLFISTKTISHSVSPILCSLGHDKEQGLNFVLFKYLQPPKHKLEL